MKRTSLVVGVCLVVPNLVFSIACLVPVGCGKSKAPNRVFTEGFPETHDEPVASPEPEWCDESEPGLVVTRYREYSDSHVPLESTLTVNYGEQCAAGGIGLLVEPVGLAVGELDVAWSVTIDDEVIREIVMTWPAACQEDGGLSGGTVDLQLPESVDGKKVTLDIVVVDDLGVEVAWSHSAVAEINVDANKR